MRKFFHVLIPWSFSLNRDISSWDIASKLMLVEILQNLVNIFYLFHPRIYFLIWRMDQVVSLLILFNESLHPDRNTFQRYIHIFYKYKCIILTLQLTCWEATSPSWPGTSCCWSGEWGCLCPWCWWLVCDINWLIHTSLGPLQWVLSEWARAFSRVLHTKQHCIVEAERVKQRQCWDVTQCGDQPGSSDNQDDREPCVMSSDIRIDKTIISLDYTDQDWFLSILVSVLLLMISLVLFLRASIMSFLYFGEKVSL